MNKNRIKGGADQGERASGREAMDRVPVFIDAGYLYAGGAKSFTGIEGTRRHDINLDIPTALRYLIAKAEAISQQKLLRIYWYDAAPSGRLATDHQILASTDNVKLRLGVINGFGQQKGVDGKIITDLTELSRNRADADAVLLGGDEDLRIGVELAQEYVTRVHLLTIEGSGSSPTLRQESDTVTLILRTDLQTFLSIRSAAPPTTGMPSIAPPVVLAQAGAAPTFPAFSATTNAPQRPAWAVQPTLRQPLLRLHQLQALRPRLRRKSRGT
jgi:uncharacterized LabA/DUF88 family protein